MQPSPIVVGAVVFCVCGEMLPSEPPYPSQKHLVLPSLPEVHGQPDVLSPLLSLNSIPVLNPFVQALVNT